MRLRELEGAFLKILETRQRRYTEDLADAQGVMFRCPKCIQENLECTGTHFVICWFAGRGVGSDEAPGPGRWTPEGRSIDDLTLEGATPDSARTVRTQCKAKFVISHGEVTLC